MSSLDRHVSAVQNKLAVGKFVYAWAWVVLLAGMLLTTGVLIERIAGVDARLKLITPAFLLAAAPLLLFMAYEMYSRGTFGGYLLLRLTVATALFGAAFLARSTHVYAKWPMVGLGAIFLATAIYAILRRPRPQQAAVAIDAKLNLDEKFSTALYARSLADPFARAAVLDAENAANRVQLGRQFPLVFPRAGMGALAFVTAALIAFLFMPQMDLFGRQQAIAEKKKVLEQQAVDNTRRVERALEVVQAAPPSLLNNEAFQIKVRELKEMAKQGRAEDSGRMSRKAEDVLKDVEKSLKEEADRTQMIADKQTATLTQSLGDVTDSKSPVAKVEKAMSNGDFSSAVQGLEKIVDQFDKMDDKQKQDAAKDMQKLADKLQKAAQDPKTQEQIQKQLQQMGADQNQAKQMASDMQKAAQGDKQAAANLQNQAQQMQKQLQNQIQQAQQQAAAGNQQAAQQAAQLQQQQQQLNQAMQGMQAMANAQAQAGNMGQAAQQMAAGMKQQAAAQAQQGGQQQNGQQQGGQQQAGNQAGQQQIAQGKQQMQNALGQMQAAQADANQAAARQQQAQQAGQQGDGQGGDGAGQQGQNGQPNPGDGKGNGGQGEFAQGDPDQNPGGQGMGGPGRANGGQTRNKQVAPFTAKAEDDLGESREDGKILASTLVKGRVIKGDAKAGLAKITESTEKAISDEVEESHVSGLSRKAAEEYFRTMNSDAKSK